MKGIVIVDKGLEGVASQEIKEEIKSESKEEETVVIFSMKSEEDICKLAYNCQSIRRALILINKISIHSDLEKSVEAFQKGIETELKKYSSNKIQVECERIGTHDFTSVDFAKEASKALEKKKFKISRKESNITLYIYIYKNEGYLCIDYSGRDLSKRNYRIFTKAGSLKGTLAYALIRFADYKPGEVIIDPLCESGVVPIEAALMATQKSVHFYKKEFEFQKIMPNWQKLLDKEDKKIKKKVEKIYAYDKTLRNIDSTKKNAKIAGVEKNINFSKTEIEWLDTKFEEKSVDKIVTKLPSESKKMPLKFVEKMYQEFFYQVEYVLKAKGLAVICTLRNDLLKKESEKKNLQIIEEKKVFSGQQEYTVTIFKKVYKE